MQYLKIVRSIDLNHGHQIPEYVKPHITRVMKQLMDALDLKIKFTQLTEQDFLNFNHNAFIPLHKALCYICGIKYLDEARYLDSAGNISNSIQEEQILKDLEQANAACTRYGIEQADQHM